jgi:hypothetical protein
MAKKKFPVHYANFVCHFGDAELIDYLDEIVLPAFLSDGVRTFKDGKYFFHSPQLLNLGSGKNISELAICGRFVKDMVVRSEQRYDAATDSVLPDNQRMETAPSAIFVLLLAPHKLIYLLETANAPGLESFRSTVSSFLGRERRKYIEDLQKRSVTGALTEKESTRFLVNGAEELSDVANGALVGSLDDVSPKKLAKKRLSVLLPPADLEVVALSNDESLRAFVSRFKTLQSATLRLVKPNSEVDNDDFLATVRVKADAVGSETASLIYKNPEGLIKSQVVKQFETAASEGNTEIRLDGKDETGQILRGSNDEFKVVSYLEVKPSGLLATARSMLKLFKAQSISGLIKASAQDLSERSKIQLAALAQRAKGASGGGA